MRNSLLILSFCFFFIACQSEQPPLSNTKMAKILSDLHMAESFAQMVPKDNGDYSTKNVDTLQALYSHIYKKHKIDTASFSKALSWYKQRPKEFDKVYEEVLEVLSIRKELVKDSIIEYSDSTEVFIKDTLQE